MGLPATITLNIGPTGAKRDVVFQDAKILGNKTTYTAASVKGDLLGRPSLVFSQETKARGVVGTLVRLQFPHHKGGDLGYHSQTPTIHSVINVPADIPTAIGDELLEAQRELLAIPEVANAIATGTL